MAARVRVLCIARRHESDDKRPRLFMDMLMNHTALLRGAYARRTTYIIYVLKLLYSLYSRRRQNEHAAATTTNK